MHIKLMVHAVAIKRRCVGGRAQGGGEVVCFSNAKSLLQNHL